MILKDLELGIEVDLPSDWSVNNSSDGMEIEISKGSDCKIIILRGGKASTLYLSKVIRKLGCDEVFEGLQICNDKKTYVKRLNRDAIIAHCMDNSYKKILEKLTLFEPSIGYLSNFRRISSPRHKWYLSVPENWNVKEAEPFGDSVFLSSGNIRAWIIVYPATDLFDIKFILEKRFEILTRDKYILEKDVIKSLNRMGIFATIKENRKKFILGIEISKHKVQGDVEGFIEADFSLIMETGYLAPAHVKDGVLEIIGKIFSSYAFGVNFLSEFLRMSNPRRFLYALAFETKMMGIDLYEMLEGYLKAGENLKSSLNKLLK